MLQSFIKTVSPSALYRPPFYFFGTKTILFNYQKDKLNGKIVDFAGFDMPVQFKTSIFTEHNQVRQKAGTFDVSHMGQIHVFGRDRIKFIESFCTGDVKEIKPHHCLYSLIPNKNGGIIDDFIISKLHSFVNLVVNAGTTKKDLKHIREKLEEFKDNNPGSDVTLEHITNKGLIALQGPKAMRVLSKYVKENLTRFGFMQIGHFTIPKINERILLRRSGYTGEDGFEIAISNKNMVKFYDMLLHDGNDVLPCGLGARDTLRLEAGMCLYGHEIDDNRSPIEAGLSWAIGKRRRKEGGFDGYEIIKKQMKKGGIKQKRVGFIFGRGAIPREHTTLCNEEGEKVGMISSGTFSPTLRIPIAMGYVPLKNQGTKVGTTYYAMIRNRPIRCSVTKIPFVKNNYYRV